MARETEATLAPLGREVVVKIIKRKLSFTFIIRVGRCQAAEKAARTVFVAAIAPGSSGINISTETPDLKLAKRFHRQKLDEFAADRQGLKQFTTPQHPQLQFGPLLGDLVSDYRVRRLKSLASVLSHLKPLREHFGD